jgi:hypothetical protein
MVRVRGYPPTDEAGLARDKSQMLLGAMALRLTQGQDALVNLARSNKVYSRSRERLRDSYDYPQNKSDHCRRHRVGSCARFNKTNPIL